MQPSRAQQEKHNNVVQNFAIRSNYDSKCAISGEDISHEVKVYTKLQLVLSVRDTTSLSKSGYSEVFQNKKCYFKNHICNFMVCCQQYAPKL